MVESVIQKQGDGAELAHDADCGARHLHGWQANLVAIIAFSWCLFHLYAASNLPSWISSATGLNIMFDTVVLRIIHMTFALALVSFAFPLFSSSKSSNSIPWYDWILAIIGASSCLYLLIFKTEIERRSGLPTNEDLIFSAIGVISLLLATYRVLGIPLLIIVGVFIFYCFFGHLDFIPGQIQWKGASYSKALWNFWMDTQGIFGVPLKVSATVIFLFVMFGGILEHCGGGQYFIKVAFAVLGRFRGGPAKAAVVSSALSGVYSGSSIANVVTTGTFTIPMMKKTGFSAEKAGAVEVSASVNGQLTPPVMGAAAFLIAEFSGVAYEDILKHALIPAIIAYAGLFYIVHLEAVKLGLKGIKSGSTTHGILRKIMSFLFGFIAICLFSLLIYYTIGWVKLFLPDYSFVIISLLLTVSYIAFIKIAAKYPDLEPDDPNAEISQLPKALPTIATGLYYILPIIVLVWFIMVERISPSTSATVAVSVMIAVGCTHNFLKALFRGEKQLSNKLTHGCREVFNGMVSGARSMVMIAVATGIAGIIVGITALTGIHQVIGEFVEALSGGSLIFMLLLVATMSLILGLGLPTTANYVVVSVLMVPVILDLGRVSGFHVERVAVDLFIFYFGVMADITPPVGLAAFAAAAISGGNPLKTGVYGFFYSIRTIILPFMFLFNTDLLLINVGIWQAILVFVIALIAMLLFAAATQHYFLVKNRIWETIALMLIAFTLFRPGFWLDIIDAPYEIYKDANNPEIVKNISDKKIVNIKISGYSVSNPDKIVNTTLGLELKNEYESVAQWLKTYDLTVDRVNNEQKLTVGFSSPHQAELAKRFDIFGPPLIVTELQIPKYRIYKEVFYIPALAILLIIILLQLGRRKRNYSNDVPKGAVNANA